MKKRKLIITIVSIMLFAFISIAVLAEVYYERKVVDRSVELGNATIGTSKYLSYAKKVDGAYTTERLETPEEITVSQSVTCYASEKTGYTGEDEYISLNQLGFSFTYTNSVDVYVRVQVRDAWISRKFYAGSQEGTDNYMARDHRNRYVVATGVNASNVTNYLTLTATKQTSYNSSLTYYSLSKGTYIEATNVSSSTDFTKESYYTITTQKATTYSSSTTYYYNSNSPFSVQSENWVYDNVSGYIYYKLISKASTEAKTVSFDINENYTYVNDAEVIGYREAILVQVGFNIDIVQANRAKAKWGIDMTTYFD